MSTAQSRTAEKDTPNRLTEAIAEYMRRIDDGGQVDRDRFLCEHAEVANELGRYLDDVALVEQLAGPTLGTEEPRPEQEQRNSDSDPTSEEHVEAKVAEQSRRETVAATQGGDSVPESRKKSTETPLAREFGRYRIEKALGEGAMGTVYLARDTQLHRRVALKVPKFSDDDPEMMERFCREARAAAGLRHRNICPVHDIGEIDGTRYISMGYIEGKPLSAFVSPDKPPSERNVAIVVRKLALALEVAHREGVIHRDLKPANIILDKKSEPVIMDFGLARQLNKKEDERLTQTGTVMGSPAYMSPEQVNAENDRIGPASDIYSLGVILYELITGRLPFEGSIAAVIGQIMVKEPEKPSTFRPDLDPRLEAICEKMMAKQIEDRYASMQQAAAALTDFLKNRGEKPENATLMWFEAVELEQIAEQAAASQVRRGKKSRRRRSSKRAATVIGEVQPASAPLVASGGRKPPVSRKRLSLSDRIADVPGWAWGIAGAFGALLLVWGVTLLLRTPEGTLRFDVNDPNLKIHVDGETVTFADQLSQERRFQTGTHRLAVMIGDQKLNLGETTTVRLDGEDQKVTLSLAGVELSGDEFTVTRGDQQVLRITVDSTLVTSTSGPNSTNERDKENGGSQQAGPAVPAASAQNATAQTAAVPVTELLKKPVSVAFRRTPLYQAVEEIGKQAGLEIQIDGDALKAEGYTRNMTQNFSMTDTPAEVVLSNILKQYQEMVLAIAGGHALVTTREAAKAQSLPVHIPFPDTKPAEATPTQPAENVKDRGEAIRTQADEIEALIASETKKATFGRPPVVSRIEQFAKDEIDRRKKDGRLGQNVNITFLFGPQGNIMGRRITVGFGGRGGAGKAGGTGGKSGAGGGTTGGGSGSGVGGGTAGGGGGGVGAGRGRGRGRRTSSNKRN